MLEWKREAGDWVAVSEYEPETCAYRIEVREYGAYESGIEFIGIMLVDHAITSSIANYSLGNAKRWAQEKDDSHKPATPSKADLDELAKWRQVREIMKRLGLNIRYYKHAACWCIAAVSLDSWPGHHKEWPDLFSMILDADAWLKTKEGAK